MSVSTTYDFTDPVFDLTDTELSGGKGRLLLQDGALALNQPFTSDAGFTYNSLLAEFTGGLVRQKDQTAANSIMAAKYTSSSDLNWNKSGVVTGTLNGAPTLAGGKLVCTGAQGIYYQTNTLTVSSHKFKYTPNYTTTPPANINLYSIYNGTNNNDRFHLTNSPSGNNLRLTLYNNVGGVVIALATVVGASWTPTSGIEYEFEVVINSVSGTVRVFVDGVLHGTLSPGAWTRGTSASRFYVGACPVVYNQAEGSFDDFIMFDNAQHTSSYTPGYTVADSIYSESKIDLPALTYLGPTDIASLVNIVTTEVLSPQYIVEGQYWNGALWVASNGTYAQSNTKAVLNTNLPSLSIAPATTSIAISIVLPSSNSISSVDDLTLNYLGGRYESSGNIELASPLTVKEAISIAATINTPAGTTIGFAISVDGILMYWNGAAWAVSNGTYAQSNTTAVLTTNFSSLSLGQNSTVNLYMILDTSDSFVTPDIDSMTFVYTFGGISVEANTCAVWGYYLDVTGEPIPDATVTFALVKQKSTQYEQASNNIIGKSISVLTDAYGYFVADLIWSSEYEGSSQQYRMSIVKEVEGIGTTVVSGSTKIDFLVPDSIDKDVTDLITAV